MGAAGSKLEKALGEQFPRRNSELSVKELLARFEAGDDDKKERVGESIKDLGRRGKEELRV
ncbi:Ubiquitin carboxyl-terminal hydrolase 3 [Bienertia sinuspersici]